MAIGSNVPRRCEHEICILRRIVNVRNFFGSYLMVNLEIESEYQCRAHLCGGFCDLRATIGDPYGRATWTLSEHAIESTVGRYSMMLIL